MRKQNRQAGVFVVIFSLTMPVLLGLLVLAIDCGSLYLARLRLTKVARVASGTGLNILALRGWGAMVANPESPPSLLGLKTANAATNPPQDTTANEELLAELHQSTVDELRRYYPSDFNDRTGASYLRYKYPTGNTYETSEKPTLKSLNLSKSDLTITLRYAIRTYLLSALSQMFGTLCNDGGDTSDRRCWIESSPTPELRTGRLRSANVMMLLDVSGSMNEPSGSQTKMSRLVEAAAAFIDMFNPKHDRFAIIPYGTTADTGITPKLAHLDTENVSNYLRIKEDIQGYQVGGQTNQCDALIQVIDAIEKDTSLNLRDKRTPKFVLLFTDGAPNVYRLNFCEGNDCSRAPALLQTALNEGPANADASSPGWYGWTVKWDRREVFQMTSPNDTCPTTDDAATPAECQDEKDNDGDGLIDLQDPGCKSAIDDDESNNGNSNAKIPECDPVWAFPKVIAGNPGPELTYAEVSARLRLSETKGEFYLQGAPGEEKTLKQLGYTLKFKDWGSSAAAYQSLDAFRWHGPSYLVHSSFRVPMGFSLIDRIPTELIGAPPPITCGPGSLHPLPGSRTKTGVADKYNHSRYFASRVVDANWRWNGSPNDDSEDKADKNGLTLEHLQNAPAYFDRPHTLQGNPNDTPGCLNSLNSKVPFTNAQILVGENFVSNPPDSIRSRGEAVKTAELPYYCALRAADWLRSEYNVVIFVVGLGQSASSIYGNACEDPLQNALDPNSRKDRFLRRLAFAPESLSDPAAIFARNPTNLSWSTESDFSFRPQPLNSCQNHPLAGLTVELGYGEGTDNKGLPKSYSPNDHGFSSEHLGAYFPSEDAGALKIIFGEIAKRVLLRLAT